MAHRLINCKFLNAGAFNDNLSNKAKLLYMLMLTYADDKGFVDTTSSIIKSLEANDEIFNGPQVNMALVENDYQSALQMLLDKGYLYEFRDNHGNSVHLIRHWFFHQKFMKNTTTNYFNYLKLCNLDNNKYVRKKEKGIKEKRKLEDNISEDNISEDKVRESINRKRTAFDELEDNDIDKNTDTEDEENLDLPF